jgi:hypothetical protein
MTIGLPRCEAFELGLRIGRKLRTLDSIREEIVWWQARATKEDTAEYANGVIDGLKKATQRAKEPVVDYSGWNGR